MKLLHFIQINTFWLVARTVILVHVQGGETTTETCKAIPIEDIQEAAFLSYDIYEFKNLKKMVKKIKHKLKEKEKVRAESKYVVEKIYKKDLKDDGKKTQKRSWMDLFSMNWSGNPLRVVTAKKGTTTIICFMGTRSLQQLINEFWDGTDHRVAVDFKDKNGQKKTVKILKYFWDAFKSLEATVLSKIKLDSDRKYIVTGHSLGGALASLFALYMVDKQNGALFANPGSSLITFGQPRVGDLAYAELHDEWIPAFKKPRFVYDDDVVPHIPYLPDSKLIKMLTNIPLIGPITLPEHYDKFVKYEHTWREMWIEKLSKKTFEFHVCPNRDGDGCSIDRNPLKRTFGFVDHDGEKYVKAITILKDNQADLNQFIKDQCPNPN